MGGEKKRPALVGAKDQLLQSDNQASVLFETGLCLMYHQSHFVACRRKRACFLSGAFLCAMRGDLVNAHHKCIDAPGCIQHLFDVSRCDCKRLDRSDIWRRPQTKMRFKDTSFFQIVGEAFGELAICLFEMNQQMLNEIIVHRRKNIVQVRPRLFIRRRYHFFFGLSGV